MSFTYDEAIDGPLPTVDRAELAAALRARAPALEILTDREDLRPFECDGLAAYRTVPLLVALPSTIEEVRAVLMEATARGVPVVARGAGTGLSGGAMPLEKGILLVMAKFNRILNIDADAGTVSVWKGGRP